MFKYDVLHIVTHPIAIKLQDNTCFLKYSSPFKTPFKVIIKYKFKNIIYIIYQLKQLNQQNQLQISVQMIN